MGSMPYLYLFPQKTVQGFDKNIGQGCVFFGGKFLNSFYHGTRKINGHAFRGIGTFVLGDFIFHYFMIT